MSNQDSNGHPQSQASLLEEEWLLSTQGEEQEVFPLVRFPHQLLSPHLNPPLSRLLECQLYLEVMAVAKTNNRLAPILAQ